MYNQLFKKKNLIINCIYEVFMYMHYTCPGKIPKMYDKLQGVSYMRRIQKNSIYIYIYINLFIIIIILI